ncbi:MAG: tRNA (adenosine(37)-N6)-dimethylallyltransferase MiaA [Pseudomonadota bacterium]
MNHKGDDGDDAAREDAGDCRATRPVIILTGVTASGKSRLAMTLAQRFEGVIINADSMQVYHDLPILTAQPTPEDQVALPHALYGVVKARKEGPGGGTKNETGGGSVGGTGGGSVGGMGGGSVGWWVTRARAQIKNAHQRGQVPFITGGTMMYARALMAGLSPIPPVDDAVRAAARARFAAVGHEAFARALIARDPAGGAVATDPQRLIRAYEVLEATGKPLRHWQTQVHRPPCCWRFIVVIVQLLPAAQITAATMRLEAMLAGGMLDEVARAGIDPACPLAKAHGLREFRAYLAGELTRAVAIQRTVDAMKTYSKRQRTWLRNHLPGPAEACAQAVSWLHWPADQDFARVGDWLAPQIKKIRSS